MTSQPSMTNGKVLITRMFITIVAFILLSFSSVASAVSSWCTYNNGSAYPFTYDLGRTTFTQDINQTGHSSGAMNFNISDSVRLTCTCDVDGSGEPSWVFSASSPLPMSGYSQFYKINEYLGMKVEFYDSVAGYKAVPFNDWKTHGETKQCSDFKNYSASDVTGSQGRIQLVVLKPFIGTTIIPNTIVANFWSCFTQYGTCTPYGPVAATVSFTGTVVVPQTCTIEPGTIFQIDLGQIAQKNFVSGGVGQRPSGYVNRPLTVKLKCAGGVQSNANLTLRLQGTSSNNFSNALSTDNPDIGVVVTKPDGASALTPNDLNSLIPFNLNNGEGNVVIQAYPISTTGQAPKVGNFSSLSTLRFDFP